MAEPAASIREGGRFRRALATALAHYDKPRIGIVAHTPSRSDYIRQICLKVLPDAEERVTMYIDDEASDALARTKHEIVVLDASLPAAMKTGLTEIARDRLKTCTVIQIRKWSKE